VSVKVDVKQTINGISFANYLADQATNDLVLKTSIAGCMDGITVDDVTDLVASAAAARRALQVRTRVNVQDHRALQSDSIAVTYTILTVSQLTSQQLFAQLNNNVNDGTFTILLRNAAVNNNALSLTDASSDSTTNLTPENTDSQSDGDELSDGAIAGIVIGGVVFLVLVAIVAWYFCARKSDSAVVPTAGRAYEIP
jgi:hypothetical protein